MQRLDRIESAVSLKNDPVAEQTNYWLGIENACTFIDKSASGSKSVLSDTGDENIEEPEEVAAVKKTPISPTSTESSGGGVGHQPRPHHTRTRSEAHVKKVPSSPSFRSLSRHDSESAVYEISRNPPCNLPPRKQLSFGDTLDTTTNIYTPEIEFQNSRYADDRRFQPQLGEDDSGSLSSLYMERDLRYFFQHPTARLAVCYSVIFCNFLIFAEDPISHSVTESDIPIFGNVFSFVLTKYPPEWTWSMIKVFFWIVAVITGMVFGKIVIHHGLCHKVLRLKMFRDDQGSWFCMFLTVLPSLYFFSYIYNVILLIAYHGNSDYVIDSTMGIQNSSFMKFAACGTWLGDLFTAWFVTDMILQDNLYPKWQPSVRHFWRSHNNFRVIIFWFGFCTISIAVVSLIISDYITWDALHRGFIATTEISRAFLASFILFLDLIIIMQDWDFPHFNNPIAVNLSGFSVASLHIRLFEINITGKWFNYGIILMVMLLDLNMYKNQIFYYPEGYGQCVDEQFRIHAFLDCKQFLTITNQTVFQTVDFDEVNATVKEADMVMNSRYINSSIITKALTFFPSILGFGLFFTLVSLYGRFPRDSETQGGRLRKRHRCRRQSSWYRERPTTGVSISNPLLVDRLEASEQRDMASAPQHCYGNVSYSTKKEEVEIIVPETTTRKQPQ
ncbi:unnamed protein product [Cyprideis torosa]|uniref:Uncharacterized protein n=1 Tax=Cyprideis torosa TaxID=163714 RepID=A0A7R8ZGL3_9CRUS|nr:unnamed protein product [Cyprideis torosa]CAG0880340.1 unnamed protein product [Cyprideis torosa]